MMLVVWPVQNEHTVDPDRDVNTVISSVLVTIDVRTGWGARCYTVSACKLFHIYVAKYLSHKLYTEDTILIQTLV